MGNFVTHVLGPATKKINIKSMLIHYVNDTWIASGSKKISANLRYDDNNQRLIDYSFLFFFSV